MKKKYLYLNVITIVVVMIMVIKNHYDNTDRYPKSTKFTSTKNIFFPVKGSIGIATNETLPINFTYLYSDEQKDLFKNINSITISNTNNIEIKNYKVNGDGKLGRYHIKTLVVEVVGKSVGNTEINSLAIETTKGKKIYKIGKLNFNVINSNADSPLETGEFYPVVRDRNNNYIYNLKNVGNKHIEILNFLTSTIREEYIISPSSKALIISPNKSLEGELSLINYSKNDTYPILAIRPIIQYKVNNQEKILLPPPTWYGLIGINYNQIIKALKYNK